MSHHHHPHEGHSHGNPPKSKPIHHDWRFYAAAGLIILAMVAYLLSGDLLLRPKPLPAPAPAGNP
jgi:hypothetical protein